MLAALLMLFAAAGARLVSAQESMAGPCVKIDESWQFCSGLHGAYLDTSISLKHSIAGSLFVRPAGSNNSLWRDIFASNFQTFIDPEKMYMPNDLTPTNAAVFRDKYYCPGYTNWHRRYLVSMWCMDIVHASLNRCPENKNFRPMCRDTCYTYAHTTFQSLNNLTQCPLSVQDAPTRYRGAQETDKYCNTDPFSGKTGNCISGDVIEPGTCGYLVKEQICNPAVCGQASPQFCIGVVSGVSDPSTTHANTASDVMNQQQTKSETGILAPLVIGSVLAALFLSVLTFYMYRRTHVVKKRPSSWANGSGGNVMSTNDDNNIHNSYGNTPTPHIPDSYTTSHDECLYTSLRSPEDLRRPLYSTNNPMSTTTSLAIPPSTQYPKKYSQRNESTGIATLSNSILSSSNQDAMSRGNSSDTLLDRIQKEKQSLNNRLSSLTFDKSATLDDLLTASLAADKALGATAPLLFSNDCSNHDTDNSYSTLAHEYGLDTITIQYIVTRSYRPTLGDELELAVDDILSIRKVYDDGWGYGINLSTGQIGVLPISFAEETGEHYQDPLNIPFRPSEFSNSSRLRRLHTKLLVQQQEQLHPLPMPSFNEPLHSDYFTSSLTNRSISPSLDENHSRSYDGPISNPSRLSPLPSVLPSFPDDYSFDQIASRISFNSDSEPQERNVQRSRISVSAAKRTFRETTYVVDDQDATDHEDNNDIMTQCYASTPDSPLAKSMSITALMDILARIAQSDGDDHNSSDLDSHQLDDLAPRSPQQVFRDLETVHSPRDDCLSLDGHYTKSNERKSTATDDVSVIDRVSNNNETHHDERMTQHSSLFHALGLNPNEFDTDTDSEHGYRSDNGTNYSRLESNLRDLPTPVTDKYGNEVTTQLYTSKEVTPQVRSQNARYADTLSTREEPLKHTGQHYNTLSDLESILDQEEDLLRQLRRKQ